MDITRRMLAAQAAEINRSSTECIWAMYWKASIVGYCIRTAGVKRIRVRG